MTKSDARAHRFAVLLALLLSSVGGAAGPVRNGFVLAPVSIPVAEILAGGPPRDGIPALDHPAAVPGAQADWADDALVLGLVAGGEARAYPVAVLDWHELVNDTLGGEPILVSFCPLCGSGMVFDRRVGGEARRFGVSGLLYRSDLLMYDRDSESLWSQISAEAVTGPLLGQRLRLLRSRMDAWGRWRREHPETTVLPRETGHRRDYDRSPYGGYAQSSELMFPVPVDRRYHPKLPTVGLRIVGEGARAYPASELARAGGSVDERFLGRSVRITYDPDRQVFDVRAPPDVEVVEGFWFASAAFHPETSVYIATTASEPEDGSAGSISGPRGGAAMESASQMPATLNDALATEPLWLQAWVMVLVVANVAALLFAVGRKQGRWRVRPEPVAIVASFVAAGLFMGWLYEQVGYVRLLGLAHLVCWGPVWGWILSRRSAIGTATLFGKYVHVYLVIAGTSLLIDGIDVIRYLLGDGELLHRWS